MMTVSDEKEKKWEVKPMYVEVEKAARDKSKKAADL